VFYIFFGWGDLLSGSHSTIPGWSKIGSVHATAAGKARIMEKYADYLMKGIATCFHTSCLFNEQCEDQLAALDLFANENCGNI